MGSELGVKKSPIAAFAPENGLPINSGSECKEWLDDDDEPVPRRHDGQLRVRVDYRPATTNAFQPSPDLNRPRTQQLQTTITGSFPGVPWDAGLDLTRQIERS